MKIRPIIFNSEMVKAVLDGCKTQTRRVIKPQPHPNTEKIFSMSTSARDGNYIEWRWWSYATDPGHGGRIGLCPYGAPGDHLWVRETWTAHDDYNGPDTSTAAEIGYRADGARLWRDIPEEQQRACYNKLTGIVNRTPPPWRPSIHMPRWASRITLTVVNVRAERVQDITEVDAKAEGVDFGPVYATPSDNEPADYLSARDSFALLWDSINGKRPGCSWVNNPWVWIVEFERVGSV